jgi:hypothetical protein
VKLFRTLDKTDYQDALRVIGLFLDEHGYRDFRLIEHEDGIIVQARPTRAEQHVTSYETFLITDDELQRLLREAYGRRDGTMGVQPVGLFKGSSS